MNARKILLIRTDRIGDVMLTLPMIDLIRGRWPNAEISFLAREYTRDIIQQHPEVSRVLVEDDNGRPRPDLLREVRSLAADVAIHVYPRPHLAWLTVRAGIPVRIGSAFRWYSFMFNRRVRDHRRSGGLHESIYNARLLSPIGIEAPDSVRPTLRLTEAHQAAARRVLEELRLRPGNGFFILHPGTGGSARDWSPTRFSELATILAASSPVIITGAHHEADLVARVVQGSGGKARACIGKFSLMEFAAFISHAKLFVSNSTGPLHMAAAVGTPVIGLYPPFAAVRVERWGPLGDRAATFTPDPAQCPQCLGGPCRGNICMEQIHAEAVAQKAEQLLKRS